MKGIEEMEENMERIERQAGQGARQAPKKGALHGGGFAGTVACRPGGLSPEPSTAHRARTARLRAHRLLSLAAALFLLLPLLLSCAASHGQTPPAAEECAIPAADFPVYIDAGHGGFDTGAVACLPDGTQVEEKGVVLSVSLLLAEELTARGYPVRLSRTGDERMTYSTSGAELAARRADAAGAAVSLLLSVHANSYAGAGRAFGPRVYYHPASSGGAAAAALVSGAISEHTGAICGRNCKAVPDGSYAILGDPTLPTLLIELGFLSDAAELALLVRGDYQARLARAIADGVDACRLAPRGGA